jgi:hypothetical protein
VEAEVTALILQELHRELVITGFPLQDGTERAAPRIESVLPWRPHVPSEALVIVGERFTAREGIRIPGRVLMLYELANGANGEVELARADDLYGPGGLAWFDRLITVRIPRSLSGLRSQRTVIRVVRSDGQTTEFPIPFDPILEIVRVNGLNAEFQVQFGDTIASTGEYFPGDEGGLQYTVQAYHVGFGSGGDLFSIPALRNDWKVRGYSWRIWPGAAGSAVASAHFNVLPVIGDDVVQFSVDWSVGKLPEIPVLGISIPVPIVGEITYEITVWIQGPLGVPFR